MACFNSLEETGLPFTLSKVSYILLFGNWTTICPMKTGLPFALLKLGCFLFSRKYAVWETGLKMWAAFCSMKIGLVFAGLPNSPHFAS